MRLLLVWRADPTGRYEWLPRRQPGDAVVTFDDLAAQDLAARRPLRFDDLQTWEDRTAEERRVSAAFDQLQAGPLGQLALDGYEFLDFAEHSLRVDLAHVVRGWCAATAVAPRSEVVADPASPSALLIGALAGAELPPSDAPYAPAQPPSQQPSRFQRVASRLLVRGAAATRGHTGVRVAVTPNYKLTPALAGCDPADLRAVGVGLMPLPGFDSRQVLRSAREVGLPVLPTLDPIVGRRTKAPKPVAAEIDTGAPALDEAFGDVATRLAAATWRQLEQAVRATRSLDELADLRAIVLPTLFSGTPRVFTAWAKRRGVTVGALQHGLYAFRSFNGQDRGADVLLIWGEAVADQARAWSLPGVSMVNVGSPGVLHAPPRRPRDVRRVMLATTGPSLESILSPAALHDWFVDAVLPAAAWLQSQGIKVELRLHPSERPERYGRAMDLAGVSVPFGEPVPFATAIDGCDVLISSFSSVALEAAALGVPVLMWQPDMPAAYRREHLVPPWTATLPGMFHTSAELLDLAEGLLERGTPSLDRGRELSELLAGYAEPFNGPAFTGALRDLAS